MISIDIPDSHMQNIDCPKKLPIFEYCFVSMILAWPAKINAIQVEKNANIYMHNPYSFGKNFSGALQFLVCLFTIFTNTSQH